MRYLLVAIFALSCLQVLAQKPNEENLKESIADFNKALLKKDTSTINEIVDDNITYGHSSGWVQTKRELIRDLYNGKIEYDKILPTSQKLNINENTAWVRENYNIDATLDKKPLQFSVNVVQTWIWRHKRWILFARQSVAVSKHSAAPGTNAY